MTDDLLGHVPFYFRRLFPLAGNSRVMFRDILRALPIVEAASRAIERQQPAN